MTELFGTPEQNEKALEEAIVRLRVQIEDEKAETHHRIQRIEQDSKQRIRDAHRDFIDRTAPLQRELDGLIKAASLKHAYSTVPPMLVDKADVLKIDRGEQ